MNGTEMLEKAAKLFSDGMAITTAADAEGRDLNADERQKIEGYLSEGRALKNTGNVLSGLAAEDRAAS